jgi:CDP-6-deoxy-D-xylo-4-hexulose-3-dehydrase
MEIPLASSGLRAKDIEAINEVLNSGQLTMGPRVREFEKLMAEYLQVKHFVMVNSGSSANLAIVEALLRPAYNEPQLQLGDAVLVPAVAWPTTVWPILQLGLVPVFVDVDMSSFAIDLDKAQKTIDDSLLSIRAIFPIHPLGRAINPVILDKFCAKNDLILINDVCESLGSWSEKIHAGTSGLASSFSFYFSHHITTMEGGGIATNSDEFSDDLRSIRSHGWSRDRYDAVEWEHQNKNNDDKFLFVSTGYNIRPMEIQAAVGIEQIRDLPQFVEKRRAIARDIAASLAGSRLKLIGEETLGDYDSEQENSWMLLPILVEIESKEARKLCIQFLTSKRIETRPVLTGNFLAQPALRRIAQISQHADEFPIANKITSHAFLVGAHHDLTSEQVTYLAKTFSELVSLLDLEFPK